MEGFEWVLEIKDGMSRPAAEMKSALATLDRSLRSTEAEMRSLQRLQNTYRSAGFKQGAAEVGKDLSKLRLGAAETRAQMKALMTYIREADIDREDFVFYADRIVRHVVEEGLANLPCTSRRGRRGGVVNLNGKWSRFTRIHSPFFFFLPSHLLPPSQHSSHSHFHVRIHIISFQITPSPSPRPRPACTTVSTSTPKFAA